MLTHSLNNLCNTFPYSYLYLSIKSFCSLCLDSLYSSLALGLANKAKFKDLNTSSYLDELVKTESHKEFENFLYGIFTLPLLSLQYFEFLLTEH